MEYIAQRYGLTMTHVTYRNNVQSITDVVAGHVNSTFGEAGVSTPLIEDN